MSPVLVVSAFSATKWTSRPGRPWISVAGQTDLVIGRRKWAALAYRTVSEAAKDRISTSAASLAFHWFLAIFPAAVALLGLARLVGLSGAQLRGVVHSINVVLPLDAAKVIDQALRTPVSARAGFVEVVVGTAIALWSAVEAMAALQVSLDVAYEVSGDRGFVSRRLMSLPLIAATIVLGGAAFAMVVLGKPVGQLLRGAVPLAGPVFADVWSWARWIGAIVLIILLFSVYFTIGPRREVFRWQWVNPGSVLATLGWLGTSAGFSFYLNNFGDETRSYGALAGVAVLLLWLFLAAVFVLIGAELNCELGHSHRPDETGS